MIDMKRIPWGDSLRLSVPQLDQEHAALISLANEFTAAVSADASRAELELRLTQLIEAFQNHFQSEEELMHTRAFPEWTSHAVEHSKLISQMRELRDELALGSVHICEALGTFVRFWTEQHIQGPDAGFAGFCHKEAARLGTRIAAV
jgi:hemerythrin